MQRVVKKKKKTKKEDICKRHKSMRSIVKRTLYSYLGRGGKTGKKTVVTIDAEN